MANVTVRRATAADIPDILRVTQASFVQYRLVLDLKAPLAALNETQENIARDLETKDIWVGLVSRTVIAGCIRCQYLPGGVGYISRFSVVPNWQSSGMGKALLEAAEQSCREKGMKAMALHTSTKMLSLARFYYGQGFFVHSTRQDRGYIRGLFVKELEPDEPYSLDSVLER